MYKGEAAPQLICYVVRFLSAQPLCQLYSLIIYYRLIKNFTLKKVMTLFQLFVLVFCGLGFLKNNFKICISEISNRNKKLCVDTWLNHKLFQPSAFSCADVTISVPHISTYFDLCYYVEYSITISSIFFTWFSVYYIHKLKHAESTKQIQCIVLITAAMWRHSQNINSLIMRLSVILVCSTLKIFW